MVQGGSQGGLHALELWGGEDLVFQVFSKAMRLHQDKLLIVTVRLRHEKLVHPLKFGT